VAVIEPPRAAFTTKEAVSRVIIQEKMTEICEVDIRRAQDGFTPLPVAV